MLSIDQGFDVGLDWDLGKDTAKALARFRWRSAE